MDFSITLQGDKRKTLLDYYRAHANPPSKALSTGEQFRVTLARYLAEAIANQGGLTGPLQGKEHRICLPGAFPYPTRGMRMSGDDP